MDTLSKLEIIEQQFNSCKEKLMLDHIKNDFNQYLTSENMSNDILRNKIISLLNKGIANNNHPEINFTYENISFMVDVEIYDLIKIMWSLNIRTRYSCQGDIHDGGYVSFADYGSYCNFVNKCKSPHLYRLNVIIDDKLHFVSDPLDPIMSKGMQSIWFEHSAIQELCKSLE